jgi:hypothetical protein
MDPLYLSLPLLGRPHMTSKRGSYCESSSPKIINGEALNNQMRVGI